MTLRSLAICCAILGAMAICDNGSWGEEPQVNFIRVLVPEDRIDEFGKLFPMQREQFERLLARFSRKQDGKMEPRIELATYQATYDGRQLTDGEARLRIAREGELPQFLSWSDCNLAIRNATWETKPPRPARIGGNAAGKVGVVVENASDLKFLWQYSGDLRPGKNSELDLILPPALLHRLQITTPTTIRLLASDGVVTEEAFQPGNEQRKWVVNLGGRERVQFKFSPYDQLPAVMPRVIWRESLAYDVSLSALECQATWSLDVTAAPLKQITLRGDKGTSLSEVRVGDHSLPWSFELSTNGWQAVVDLPEPFLGPGRQVIVRTLSPAKGAGKQKLPRVLLDKALWQEGESVVRIAAPLRAEDATINAGRPLGLLLGDAADPSEQLRFQHFTRESTPELTLGRRQNSLRIVQATLVQIEASQMNATVQGEASTSGGNRFTLDAELPRGWVIDSVATVPADALEDRVISVLNEKTQRLELRLRQPASDAQRVRFEIRAHSSRPAEGSSLGINMLRVISFREAESHKLIAVDILDPTLQLQLSGDASLTRQAADELTDEEASLLSSTGTLLFHDDERADNLSLTLERRRPRFAAAANVKVEVEPSRLDYLLTIRCTPEGTPPRRMLVHLATPTQGSFDYWRGSEALGELTARRITTEMNPDSEEWLLEWSRTPTGPFEITARFSRGFEIPQLLPLVSLPEATSQSGLIEIHSAHAGIFALQTAEAEMLPIVPAGETTTRMRARLRYEPTQSPAVTLAPTSKGAGLPLTRAPRVRQHSRLSHDGSGLHRLLIDLVHDGGGNLNFRLPRGQLLQVLGEGEELETEARTNDGGDWHAVRLPGDKRRVTLEIRYRTPPQGNRWMPWNGWFFYGPEFDAPTEQREWHMLLPPGLRYLHSATNGGGTRTPQASADSSHSSTEWQPTGEWSLTSLPWPQATGTRIDIVRPAEIAALKLSCMLLFAGMILYRGWQRQPSILPALALVCAAMMGAPLGWSWALQGLAWGILAAIVCGALYRWRTTETAAIFPAARPITAAVVLAILIVTVWDCLAQEPKLKDATNLPTWKVFTRVDQEGKPSDNYLYVEPGLHALLNRPVERDAANESLWLLRNSEYRAIFRPLAEGLELTVQGEWTLDTVQTDARMEIPLSADEFTAFSAELDNRELAVDLDRDKKVARFSIPQPGEHLLRFKFRPKTLLQATGVEASVHIPHAAQTKVVVEAPAETREIECQAGIRGLLRRRGEPSASITTGSISELKWRWSAADQERKQLTTLGEQLCWWKLKPNAVTVDAIFRIRPDEGQIAGFSVITDPRLRWLPAMEGTLKGQSQPTNDGTKLEWRFVLPEPSEREVIVPITFQWLGLSGIGTFRPALVDLQVTRLERRWGAVSVSGSAALGAIEPGKCESLPSGEFVGGWSDPAVLPPEAAFRSLDAQESWSVEFRAADPLPLVSEHLRLGCQRDRTKVEYRAELKEGAARRLIHRLKVPAGIMIESVKIEERGEPIPSDWNVPKQNILSILAEAGAEREPRSIHVIGRLPALTNGPLPRIIHLEAEIESSEIEVFRARDVSLVVQSNAGIQNQREHLGNYVPEWGRQAASLRAETAGLKDQRPFGQATLTINQPQINGEMRLALERVGAGWTTAAVLDFDVQLGELDELRLEIPSDWNPSRASDETLTLELRTLPGQPRSHLMVRPSQPWTGKQRFQLHGVLTAAENGVRAPEVRILDHEDWKRYVELPTQFEKQRIRWSLSGLESVPHPKEEPAVPHRELYRLIGPRFFASVEDVEYDVGQPRVLLAEATLRIREKAQLWGEIAWELIPSGQRSCLISLPEQLRLLQIEIDSTAAVVQPLGKNQWRVQLASHDLPQRIVLGFATNWSHTSGALIELPTLKNMGIEKTVWILESDESTGRISSSPAKGSVPLEALAAHATALEVQSAALKLAGGTELTNEFPEFAADWFLARSRQRQRTAQAVENLMGQGYRSAQLEARFQAAEAEWNQSAKLFRTPTSLPQLSTTASPLPIRQVWQFAGWMPQRTLDLHSTETKSISPAVRWSVLFFLLAALGWWGLQQPWPIWQGEISPAYLLAGSGLLALLGIEPSWLGLALLATAAVWQLGQTRILVRQRSSR